MDGKRADDQRDSERHGRRAQGVKQPLYDQHGAKLPLRHAYRLQDRELPSARQDAGHDGVKEVQNAHQSDDRAQDAAEQKEHILKTLKFRAQGGFGGNPVFCVKSK